MAISFLSFAVGLIVMFSPMCCNVVHGTNHVKGKVGGIFNAFSMTYRNRVFTLNNSQGTIP